MVNNDIKNIIESLIFASEEQISAKQIREILSSFSIKTDANKIEQAVDKLNEEYNEAGSSFEIIKIAGGYQFATRKEYGVYVGKLFDEKQRKKLSQSSIETLAIIAYKQPITRNEIEFIRGVNVDYIVNSLLERDLVCITGRAETPGRPILYGTTDTFLKVLGLNSLTDLPKLKEINEILQNEKIEGITEADIDLFNSVNQSFVPKTDEQPETQQEINFDENGNAIVPEETEVITEESEMEVTEIPDIDINELEIKSTIEIDKNLEEDKDTD
ncbi:MAG: SMC-Scp complex subunit ScpB [Bacteroidetes bacterium]|nr:SMC-Scp complex subunit ScpB [Bacteroidota bacterium]